MAFVNPSAPNLADFITYAQTQGITADALPIDSPYFQWALTQALDSTIHFAPIPPILYVMAVYNFGVNWLINWAQDQSGLALESLTWAGGVVTATTAAPLSSPAGQPLAVTVLGAQPVGYNVAYAPPAPEVYAVVTGANSFTYELPTNPGAETTPGFFGFLFFAVCRQKFNLLSYTAGPVSSTGDQGTQTSLVVPEWLTNATLATQGLLKTPWGRAYLEYAQAYGPTVVGVS